MRRWIPWWQPHKGLRPGLLVGIVRGSLCPPAVHVGKGLWILLTTAGWFIRVVSVRVLSKTGGLLEDLQVYKKCVLVWEMLTANAVRLYRGVCAV